MQVGDTMKIEMLNGMIKKSRENTYLLISMLFFYYL